MLVVPWLADMYGRKWPFQVSIVCFLTAMIMIGLGEDITALYAGQFISGLTYPGRVIIGLNYLLEFNPIRGKFKTTFPKIMSLYIMMLTFTFMYQFVTRHYLYIWWTLMSMTLIASVSILVIVPESPHF